MTSTPSHLDVKIRVAQGLSLEGWNITMNLVTEITILAIGFFIGFVDPLIHEFCLLAVMGLLSDFFLQTFFFPTVLSLDMTQVRNLELTVVRSTYFYSRHYFVFRWLYVMSVAERRRFAGDSSFITLAKKR